MVSPKSDATRDPYSPEAMRIEFHRLKEEGDAVRAKSADLRKKQEDLANQIAEIEERKRPLDRQIREIEAPLADIETRRSALVRALKSKTGNADGTMPEPEPEEVPEGETAETATIG